MRSSIRWRLQAWYTLVLLVVVVGYAGLLYQRTRQARFHEIDAQVESALQVLDANLRRFPPHELDRHSPERPLPPRPPGRPDRPPPNLASRARLLAELDLPGGDRGEGTYFAIWRHDGSLLKARGVPADLPPPPAFENPPPPGRPRWLRVPGHREAFQIGPRGSCLLVGRSLHPDLAALSAFAWQLTGTGLVVLAVGLVGGWLLSARILRPVAAIAVTASAISETNLSQRIDATSVDRELADLATVLNSTFSRLEAAFARQTRFTADASHELRTPLTILRTHVELALARPRTEEQYRDTLDRCMQATRRMTSIVEALLTLARADAGRLELESEPVDLAALTEECLELLEPLAQSRSITLKADLQPALVPGDGSRLAQVVTNLLGNAVQYNRPGGEVRVSLRLHAGWVVLAVADTGVGIPPEAQPHVFERFYRVDPARARGTGGTGLGLAICKSIVEAHQGAIEFESRPGIGTTFRVRLPAALVSASH